MVTPISFPAMHRPSSRLILVLLGLGVLAPLAGAATPSADAAPAAPSIAEAISKGKFNFNARLRWENADQVNLRESDAYTLRTRFGFTSAPLEGFQGMLEAENIAVIGDDNRYNAAGTNPGGAGKTPIGDPEATGLNQAWLSYTASGNVVKAGRQRIVHDNARFVGDLGFRQNMQTYDAATLTAKPAKTVSAYYGYVWRVSRAFGNKPPQLDWRSKSHLMTLAYSGWSAGTLTAYGYLLDFKNSAPNSSSTFGASFVGAAPLSKEAKFTYRLEAARQQDAANNPLSYSARYLTGELGVVVAPFDFAIGHEILGSDGGRKGFATPLSTLHIFNGWADVFTATPARGLRDTYVSAGVALPGGFPVKVIWHDYESDNGGLDYGDEWNAIASHKIGKNWTLLAKYARYNGKPPFFDLQRFWLQAEYNF
jgi:hypothetical protein